MWARVDDSWWCHPKVMGLSPAARGVWISALSWSCQQRSPMVPVHLLGMVGGSTEEANALASAGLWEPCEGGWEIHDWADYQERSLSEKRAEAGRKGGLKSRPPKQEGSKEEPTVEAGARPDPTRPDPTEDPEPLFTGPSFDDFWEVYPKRTSKGAAKKRWDRVVRTTDPALIVAGAERYAAEVNGTPRNFLKDPAGWLHDERWLDEPGANVRDHDQTPSLATADEHGPSGVVDPKDL